MKDLSHRGMREYALLELLHRISMLNGNARRHNNFRCRIAQQMAADDTVAVIQHQISQTIAQLVLGNKPAGIRHRQLLYVITGTECFQLLIGLS